MHEPGTRGRGRCGGQTRRSGSSRTERSSKVSGAIGEPDPNRPNPAAKDSAQSEQFGLEAFEIRILDTDADSEMPPDPPCDSSHLHGAVELKLRDGDHLVTILFQNAAFLGIMGKPAGREMKIGIVFDDELLTLPAQIAHEILAIGQTAGELLRIYAVIEPRARNPEAARSLRQRQPHGKIRLTRGCRSVHNPADRPSRFCRAVQSGMRVEKAPQGTRRCHRAARGKPRFRRFVESERSAKRKALLDGADEGRIPGELSEAKFGGRHVHSTGNANERAVSIRKTRNMDDDGAEGAFIGIGRSEHMVRRR